MQSSANPRSTLTSTTSHTTSHNPLFNTSTNDTTRLRHILALLLDEAPSTVPYARIEAAMVAVGLDPTEAETIYRSVIEQLEQQGVLVVEEGSADVVWRDEDIAAQGAADEVLEELARLGARANEYRHHILTAEQERRLLEIYHDGQRIRRSTPCDLSPTQRRTAEQRIDAAEQALEELIRCNLRLIAQIALRGARRARHLQPDDLIQEGRIGLLKAIERFDLDLHQRLSTYATWWIRQAIGRALADQDRTIRLPVHVVEKLHRMQREQQRLMCELGRDPTNEELAHALDVSLKEVRLLRERAVDPISLDMPIGPASEAKLADVISEASIVMPPASMNHQEHLLTPEQFVERAVLREQLDLVMEQLNERERLVLKLRYGLTLTHQERRMLLDLPSRQKWIIQIEGGQPNTLEDVGKLFDVTRERIRQIEVKALRKLCHPKLGKKLRDFLEP